jgi:hypothetical protein
MLTLTAVWGSLGFLLFLGLVIGCSKKLDKSSFLICFGFFLIELAPSDFPDYQFKGLKTHKS